MKNKRKSRARIPAPICFIKGFNANIPADSRNDTANSPPNNTAPMSQINMNDEEIPA